MNWWRVAKLNWWTIHGFEWVRNNYTSNQNFELKKFETQHLFAYFETLETCLTKF